MTITHIKQSESIRFITYDLEWYPKLYELRMVGTFDGRDYMYYTSIRNFLDNLLVKKNRNKIFFAHNSGRSDMHFIFQEIYNCRKRYAVEAAFNGSSAFLVFIKDLQTNWTFTFADSLFLIKSSLAKIGELLGFPKGEVDFNTTNFKELVDYNEKDCRILYRAIEQLQLELRELGGDLKATIASSAMNLFRASYLSEDIPTEYPLNQKFRNAYYASRCEPFQKYCDKGHYYDVNSSFPFSMTKPLPGRFMGKSKRPKSGYLYFAEVEIEIKDCYLPPCPYRDKDQRILFPIGKWKAILNGEDINLLESKGHRILSMKCAWNYEDFEDLRNYVLDIYERRKEAQGFKKEVYKYLLNTLYGKFAEGQWKEKVLLFPESFNCPHWGKHAPLECYKMITPGVYSYESFTKISHVHVPISSYVTSYSRSLLFRFLDSCKNIYYCDTDSIVCGWSDTFADSKELGDLKWEYDIINGKFMAPKFYKFTNEKGEEKVKTKGFSRLDGAKFEDLILGGSVDIERMAGLKEIMRKGDVRPQDKNFVKRARFLKEKRFFYKNGNSRPWSVDEIEIQ
jgi:hypothetical protein